MSQPVQLVQLAACALHEVPSDAEWLAARERALSATLRLEKRRREWRLGRWCAKRALHALTALPPATIEILADADGAPVAHAAGPMPVLSISHRADRALAAAAWGPIRLGCDLEYLESRSDHFINDYLTADEAARVRAATGAERDLLANLCWSAKEAVLKALRSGLRADTRSVVVTLPVETSPAAGSEWQPITAQATGGEAFSGWWRLHGDFIETVLADRRITIAP